MARLHTPPLRTGLRPDLLGRMLTASGLLLFVLFVFGMGALIDAGNEVELALEQGRLAEHSACLEAGRKKGRADMVAEIRAAYMAGVADGAERQAARAKGRAVLAGAAQ